MQFYRHVLAFAVPSDIPTSADSVALHFGSSILQVDKVSTISQAEIWLEVQTNEFDAAKMSPDSTALQDTRFSKDAARESTGFLAGWPIKHDSPDE